MFSVKLGKRGIFDLLISQQPADDAIPYMPAKIYNRMAVKFLTLYGSKLLRIIVQKRRKGTIDHRLLTLHLDSGLWPIMPPTETTL
jgi:hypothetical protein